MGHACASTDALHAPCCAFAALLASPPHHHLIRSCPSLPSQDGSLALWSAKRKKALTTVPLAHGAAPWGGPCWITALTSPPFSDVVASGSCDGHIRFWHADEEERTLAQLFEVPVSGFVNGLAIAPSGKFMAAAIGQEHRLGRWFRVREARNSCCIMALPEALHTKPRLHVRRRAASVRRATDEPVDEEGEDVISDGDSDGD